MKKLAVILVMVPSMALAWGDASLEALFGPAQGEAEVVDPEEFPGSWLDELPIEGEPEPILLMTSAARAAVVEAEAPVANDGGLCRGNARIDDGIRDREIRKYTTELLKAGKTKDPGGRIVDCMQRTAETLTHGLRIACLAVEDPEATMLLDQFQADFTAAYAQCISVSPITDRQISAALADLLRR